MTNPMTPTEQDKGDLVHQITVILAKNKVKITPETTLMHDFVQLITADRKRVALEARIDELNKVDMLTKPLLLPNSGSFETNVKAWVKDRLPQLKAQQEEV